MDSLASEMGNLPERWSTASMLACQLYPLNYNRGLFPGTKNLPIFGPKPYAGNNLYNPWQLNFVFLPGMLYRSASTKVHPTLATKNTVIHRKTEGN